LPTGVALSDPRAQLFAAAEHVLAREGVSGLTSRAVTEEAGVAKGVLHRHFADFDEFVAGLVRDHAKRLRADLARQTEDAGPAPVIPTLTAMLTAIFTPVTLGLVGIVTTRNEVRDRLRETMLRGMPILSDAASELSFYLAEQRRTGAVMAAADPDTVALTLIGTAHLLFAGELGGLPDTSAVEEIVEAIVVGILPGVSGAPRDLRDPSLIPDEHAALE
jgi:AcrR family transcriptional regulator